MILFTYFVEDILKPNFQMISLFFIYFLELIAFPSQITSKQKYSLKLQKRIANFFLSWKIQLPVHLIREHIALSLECCKDQESFHRI